ncbi:MAG: hypothetical protein IH626_23660, partial [Rhodospirillales bacterium]|nr:hypothetical protein [Rhodospirillales bacterium]
MASYADYIGILNDRSGLKASLAASQPDGSLAPNSSHHFASKSGRSQFRSASAKASSSLCAGVLCRTGIDTLTAAAAGDANEYGLKRDAATPPNVETFGAKLLEDGAGKKVAL